MSIQVVDFNDPQAEKKFTASLKDIGFAVIANHPIQQNTIDYVYQKWNEFFHGSEKHQYLFDREKHDGYIPEKLSETAKGYSTKDIKEFFHFYPWGRCPDLLRPITISLYEQLSELATQLLQWLENHTSEDIKKHFSMPLSQMIANSNRTLFRIIHYPPLTGQELPGAVRAAPHEDINLITLLPAATAEGLEVKDGQGNWLPVPCHSEWIIVNAGDMLQECTHGYFPSTTHRVANPTGIAAQQSRLSMPLFLHPADSVRLSSRHTAESYRLERYQQLGLK